MGILSTIGSAFHTNTAEEPRKAGAKVAEKEQGEIQKIETSYSSKEASKAISNNAMAGINTGEQTKVVNCNTTNLTGKLFPDFDKKEITQDYLKLRTEARQKAVQTARKLYKTFETCDMSDILDKDGNIIATFSYPENKDGEFDGNSDFCSFKMTEYDPETKEIVALTRVFNYSSFDGDWKKHYAPYMERIEFGRKPEDTTYLKVIFSNKKIKDRYTLYSTVQTYAKGYKSDGIITGMRKADKFISNALHQNYESYRTNYEAPVRIFDGCLYSESASITENGGMEGEKFDSALEYPQRQLKIGDNIWMYNPYYVNEKGNREEK